MQPAICAAIDYQIPLDRVLPLIREAGFEVISLGARPAHSAYDTPEGRRSVRQLMDTYGLSIDSVHAAFPEGDRLCSLDEGERLESVRQCQAAIEAAQDLEAGIVVVHLNAGPEAGGLEGMAAQGIRSAEALAQFALTRGVQVAVENSWGEAYATVLDGVLTAVDCEAIGLCYDSGHANVDRAGLRDLRAYGHRLLTLHLHDNRGEDSHVLPYEGDVDWPSLMGLLRDLDYRGNLLLEACIANSAYRDPATFLREAYRRARRLLELR